MENILSIGADDLRSSQFPRAEFGVFLFFFFFSFLLPTLQTHPKMIHRWLHNVSVVILLLAFIVTVRAQVENPADEVSHSNRETPVAHTGMRHS